VHDEISAALSLLDEFEIMPRRILQKAQQGRGVRRALAATREIGQMFGRQPRLARDVETDRHQRRRALAAKASKHDARRVGIMPDIEFGGRRHIAGFLEGAAHQHKALQHFSAIAARASARSRYW